VSAVTTTPTAAAAPIVHEKALIRSWKSPIVLGAFALVALLLAFVFPRSGESTFGLSASADTIQLTPITLPTVPTVIITAILLTLIAIAAALITAFGRTGRTPLWLVTVFAILFLFAFLTWAAADARAIPVPGLLGGALVLSVPLIFGALGGVISERVGVVNVAIEGQLLFGAFTAALVASLTQNAFAGLFAAAIAGMLVSFVLAAFSIKYFVDQVIVGVVLNVLVTGLTSFFYSKVFTASPELNHPATFDTIPIPLLSDIPIIGPVLFKRTIVVYLMYVAVFLVWYGLFKTRWGLRLRSVGEHPTAADTVGINVNGTRFWNVSLAGAVAGIGGAYFTLDVVSQFNKEMTNGAGFIALAAVIFGRWDPIRATLAALLFGFATNLQSVLSIIGSPVPSEFMLMLPYLVTIAAVAGFVGLSRGPAAAGKPYIKS
jgi:ABC-type uncharacterized transport system permease subunit